jgi:hypothetical protein
MNFRTILCVCFCLFIGAMGMRVYYDIQFLDCHDFSTKHTIWKGFLAKDNDGEVRCFWLEQAYPNRIRQGVPVL